MDLIEAITILDETDFGKLSLDPELVQAISIVLIASRVRARAFQAELVAVVETSTD